MTPARRILACGHWIVDQGKRIDHWPKQQTLAMIDKVVPTNGGAAFNIACDLRRLAPDFHIEGLGRIGEDGLGDFVLATCDRFGVCGEGLRKTPDVPTSFTDVMTERDGGRRTFFHAPGANACLVETDVPLESLAPADLFYLGYLGMLPGLDELGDDGRNGASRLLEKASSLGMRTVSDLVSAPNEHLREQVLPCLRFLDVLFTNELEAARVLHRPPSEELSGAMAADLACGLSQLGVRGWVVLHFAGGAVCAADGKILASQGCVQFPPAEIVGTSGAGDAFAAGFLVGLLNDWTPAASMELAVCAAAASLRDLTCSDAVVSWPDCLALGRRYGFCPPPLS